MDLFKLLRVLLEALELLVEALIEELLVGLLQATVSLGPNLIYVLTIPLVLRQKLVINWAVVLFKLGLYSCPVLQFIGVYSKGSCQASLVAVARFLA